MAVLILSKFGTLNDRFSVLLTDRLTIITQSATLTKPTSIANLVGFTR